MSNHGCKACKADADRRAYEREHPGARRKRTKPVSHTCPRRSVHAPSQPLFARAEVPPPSLPEDCILDPVAIARALDGFPAPLSPWERQVVVSVRSGSMPDNATFALLRESPLFYVAAWAIARHNPQVRGPVAA